MSDPDSDSPNEDQNGMVPLSLEIPSSDWMFKEVQDVDEDEASKARARPWTRSQVLKSAKPSGSKEHKCHFEICKRHKSFATNQSLQTHIKNIHEEDLTRHCTQNSIQPHTKKSVCTDDNSLEEDVSTDTEKQASQGRKRCRGNDTHEDGEPMRAKKLQSNPHKKKFPDDEDENVKSELMDEDPPTLPVEYDIDVEVREIVQQNWADIRTYRNVDRPVQDVYNFRLVGGNGGVQSKRHLEGQLMAIFDKVECRCKMNVSYGVLLRHTQTCKLRYYHPSQNNARVFDSAFLVTSLTDMGTFIDKVSDEDQLKFGILKRSDTKWTVAAITNIVVYVNKMPDFPIGCCSLNRLPPFIQENKGMTSLVRSRQTSKVYEDNLCFFRCLALHRGGHVKCLEKKAKLLFQKYKTNHKVREFEGISPSELPKLEKQFCTNIMVYSLDEKEDVESEYDFSSEDEECDYRESDEESNEEEIEPLENAEPLQKQRQVRPNVKDKNKSKEGLTASKKTFAKLIHRSHKTEEKTMYVNLFESHFSYINDFNLYSRTFCCGKCGRVFRKRFNLERHDKTCDDTIKYRFPGGVYKPKQSIFERLSNEGIKVDETIDRFFPFRATFDFESYFQDIPGEVKNTCKTRLERKHVPLSFSVCSNVPGYMEAKCCISTGDSQKLINDMIDYLTKISNASYTILREKFSSVFLEIEKELSSNVPKNSDSKQQRLLNQLKKNLDEYLKEMPVVGFNSSKYDINLVKRYLYISLQRTKSIKYVIKKDSSFLTIKTTQLTFLDITNYLAQGCSYSKFLKAFDCQQAKGFFPNDWMDSLEKLDQTSLPPQEAFDNKLKQESLSIDNYSVCTDAWEENQMKTMRDFLEWYNNLDVVPFLEAIEKMAKFYKNLNIDMFKDGMSVPGLSLRYLFDGLKGDDFFTLIEAKHKDFYHTLKQNIVGGPAIVFHRYHEKGETKIRGGKQCEKVIGYDANALYLSCLMKEMPVGPFIRWQITKRGRFESKVSHSHMRIAVEWLEAEAYMKGITIHHKANASEKRIGPKRLPVDGYCEETNTVYQFHGCFWHGHECYLNRKTTNEVCKRPMRELREETKKNSDYIKEISKYTLVEIWECEWVKQKQSNMKLKRFLESRRFPLQNKKSLTETDIINAIKDREMFGFVECDISVPEHLKDTFSEMTPIFKNTDIGKDEEVIGGHMYEYANTENLLNNPRRNLIGSMFGVKILLTTPLLRWYLEKGLNVTKIYQVVQYRPSRCFETFGEDVSDARRKGDRDPSTAITADTMKLIGNSAYGKTVTNKEKFKDVKVCTEASHATRLVNDQCFSHIDDLGKDVYEVVLGKRRINVDLPLQIGLFVYQYAKLRMLEFYYDFLDRFIDRSDFQLCQMDTDSFYIAITGSDLESVIKPDMLEIYNQEKHKWLPRPEHEQHDKRTPGLFKVEYEGDGIVALCSKTYICFGTSGDKVSSKGLNKNQKNELTKQKYLDVLASQKTGVGENRGFRMRKGEMFTYSQQKGALSYLYIKRKVADDGVTTTYLDK